jgi:photoactive yellow protein
MSNPVAVRDDLTSVHGPRAQPGRVSGGGLENAKSADQMADTLASAEVVTMGTTTEIDFASLDLLPYGIIVLDVDGNVVFYNDREEQIAGRQRADVLGRNFFTEVAPCTEVSEFFDHFKEVMAAEGLTAEFAFHFPFQPDARDVEIAMTGFRVEERVLCLVAVRDVTEAERVRERILSSEKFAGVGEVAAGVAHNFNNVLMALSTWITVLERECAGMTPRGNRAITEVARVVAEGRTMIRRIASGFADTPSPAAHDADLNEVVVAAVKQAQARLAALPGVARYQIELALAEETPHVAAPAGELSEVVVNLVSNALEALDGTGSVTIRTSLSGEHGTLEIRDTGAGMSEAVQKKIFRPLFTTKGSKGTGLGLSTSYSTIRRLGGSISFQSSPGLGTVFTVTLPLLGS